MHRRRFLLLLAFCATSTLALRAAAAAPPPNLDQWVQRAMRTFEVPGIGLAIVKDDAVVIAKGYGVRTLGDPAPVDARTLFGIASNTKAFTATALGLLVEEKKIEWDAPVIRYLPAFAMWDPYVTRELTVRDLLVHRSGLGLCRRCGQISTATRSASRSGTTAATSWRHIRAACRVMYRASR